MRIIRLYERNKQEWRVEQSGVGVVWGVSSYFEVLDCILRYQLAVSGTGSEFSYRYRGKPLETAQDYMAPGWVWNWGLEDTTAKKYIAYIKQ